MILNEAVNFEKAIIFIAIPKTGTTTVRKQIRETGPAMIPQPHLDILQVRDSIYTYLLRQRLGRNEDFPNADVPHDSDLRADSMRIFNEFFKFSAVRNPWARAVSLYSRREGIPVSGSMSFDEFVEKHVYASDTCRQPTLHHDQIDWLCDENGRVLMDYIYKVEEFDRAVREIEERTEGRVRLAKRQRNKNPHSQSRNYRDVYNKHTEALIAERFARDIKYFNYEF